jgi:hypothetical protein
MTMTFAQIRWAARKMPPTKRHRPAVWECMLGTVFACNAAGEVQYFDFDWDAAGRFVGDVEDVRVSRARGRLSFRDDTVGIRQGQVVWYVRDAEVQ